MRKKIKLDYFLPSYMKINSKCLFIYLNKFKFRHFSVRPEMTKFLGENSMSFDISLSNILGGCIYSGKDKFKINKWNYINLRIFQTKAFLWRKPSTKWKDKLPRGEDIYKWYIWWGINTEITHRTQYQKGTKGIKNGQRTWIDIFTEKTYRWPILSCEKMLNITYQGNADQNHNEIISHLSEWLSSRRQ